MIVDVWAILILFGLGFVTHWLIGVIQGARAKRKLKATHYPRKWREAMRPLIVIIFSAIFCGMFTFVADQIFDLSRGEGMALSASLWPFYFVATGKAFLLFNKLDK